MNYLKKKSCWFVLPRSVFIFIWVFTAMAQNKSIREQMNAIETQNDLYAFYQENRTIPYNVRYFVHYAPDVFDALDIKQPPAWFVNVLTDALHSHYPALIREAVTAVGKYKLYEFSDRMIELFRVSQTQWTSFSTSLRCEIIATFIQFGGREATYGISEILRTFPDYCILNPESVLLFQAANRYADSTCILSVDRLFSDVRGEYETIDKKRINSPDLLNRYREAISNLYEVKINLRDKFQGVTH